MFEVVNVEPVRRPHPLLKCLLWFNGVHTNHESYYLHAQHIDTSLGAPMTTSLGNGEPLPEDTLVQIRAAFWRHSVPFRLLRGDLLVVDNMLAAHGRMSWPSLLPRQLLLTHFNKC